MKWGRIPDVRPPPRSRGSSPRRAVDEDQREAPVSSHASWSHCPSPTGITSASSEKSTTGILVG